MPHISTISLEEAEGELKKVYDKIVTERGKIAEVHKIQSLNPPALVAHMDLYMTVMFGKSPLRRYQREMIAVIVSANNKCAYCINHHEQALLAYWKDEERTATLQRDPAKAGLDKKDLLLCEFAAALTKNQDQNYSQKVDELKKAGLNDREILDATQVVAYFNFVNRLVLGLGVSFTEQEMKGYNY